MNKKQLIDAVAEVSEEPKTKVEKIVAATVSTIMDAVKKDDNVQLIGFGSFNLKKRKARTGRNPQTGKKIKIKASKTVAFKPGKGFKELLNSK
jgi:DNA-binding protein HU-beta